MVIAIQTTVSVTLRDESQFVVLTGVMIRCKLQACQGKVRFRDKDLKLKFSTIFPS